MNTFKEQSTIHTINTHDILLYYKYHMSSLYKEDEKKLKKITKRNVRSTSEDTQLKLTIFYKAKRTSSRHEKQLLATEQHLQGNEHDRSLYL